MKYEHFICFCLSNSPRRTRCNFTAQHHQRLLLLWRKNGVKMNHNSGEYRRITSLRRKIKIISVCTSPGHQQRAGGDQKQVHHINQTYDVLLMSAEVQSVVWLFYTSGTFKLTESDRNSHFVLDL